MGGLCGDPWVERWAPWGSPGHSGWMGGLPGWTGRLLVSHWGSLGVWVGSLGALWGFPELVRALTTPSGSPHIIPPPTRGSPCGHGCPVGVLWGPQKLPGHLAGLPASPCGSPFGPRHLSGSLLGALSGLPVHSWAKLGWLRGSPYSPGVLTTPPGVFVPSLGPCICCRRVLLPQFQPWEGREV